MVKFKFVNDDEKPMRKKEKRIGFKNLVWYLKMAFVLSVFQFTVLFSWVSSVVYNILRRGI